jgi:hypothetical protein
MHQERPVRALLASANRGGGGTEMPDPTARKPRARPPSTSALPPDADRSPLVICESNDYIDPRDLVALENNPRTLSDERRASLLKSVRDLGLFRPLLVWKGPDGPVVIGGNQKLPILQDLAAAGVPFILRDGIRPGGVPVTWFEGTEPQARIVALRDNNSDGDWDYPKLSDYLRGLEGLEGYDPAALSLSGFDDALLGDLVASYQTPAPVEPPPASPAAPPAAAPSAPEPVAGPQPGAPAAPGPVPAPAGAGALSDPAEQLVGVVIGHVRGKIKAPTYERLIKALSRGMETGIPEGGLDAAFAALLDRLPA